MLSLFVFITGNLAWFTDPTQPCGIFSFFQESFLLFKIRAMIIVMGAKLEEKLHNLVSLHVFSWFERWLNLFVDISTHFVLMVQAWIPISTTSVLNLQTEFLAKQLELSRIPVSYMLLLRPFSFVLLWVVALQNKDLGVSAKLGCISFWVVATK